MVMVLVLFSCFVCEGEREREREREKEREINSVEVFWAVVDGCSWLAMVVDRFVVFLL